MGLACGDVLAVEVPVEIDGGVNLLHDRVRAVREAAAPHLVAHGRPRGSDDRSTAAFANTAPAPMGRRGVAGGRGGGGGGIRDWNPMAQSGRRRMRPRGAARATVGTFGAWRGGGRYA